MKLFRRFLSVLCTAMALACALCPKALAQEAEPIEPWAYQEMLGQGMDVDWVKTDQGQRYYTPQAAQDFARAGVDHVRIRVKEAASPALLAQMGAVVQDCLASGLIPIIAYQADSFKNDPSDKNLQGVVAWWRTVANYFQDATYLLSFDLMIECTDALNKQPQRLNGMYEAVVAAIRQTNPQRIVMISPRVRSDPAYLSELEIPSQHNGYLMAEWHFYASGPSKTNPKKLWRSGTEAEKQLILDKIALALSWQEKNQIPTWVGAWMPGNYNETNDFTIEEQCAFADFVVSALGSAGIPFAVNSDVKFYDREKNVWYPQMQPVFQAIFAGQGLQQGPDI